MIDGPSGKLSPDLIDGPSGKLSPDLIDGPSGKLSPDLRDRLGLSSRQTPGYELSMIKHSYLWYQPPVTAAGSRGQIAWETCHLVTGFFVT